MKEEYKNKTVKEIMDLNLTPIELGVDLSVFNQIKNTFEKINELTRVFSESFKKTSELLNKRNPVFIEEDWYISEYFWREFNLFDMYRISPKELESQLISLFDKKIKVIKDNLLKNHEERKLLIEELFKSYKNKHFHSVILISYSITDGISKEKFGLNFWGFDKKVNSTKSSMISGQIESESVLNLIHKSLNNRGELTLKDEDIPKEKKVYTNNRNCVVHGESYLYGTKTNAIKSIFLLDFISSLQKM
jgi:hypothetical protein